MSNFVCVQYGCGFSAPAEWNNFDASPTLRFERIPLVGNFYTRNAKRFPDNVRWGDIVRGLPVDAKSVDFAYCSHVLEHLSLTAFRRALANTAQMLKSGGIFRFVLPDLEAMIRAYLSSVPSVAAIGLMKATMLGIEERPRNLFSFVKEWMGGSRHLWMWDYAGLVPELEKAGFVSIRRAEFNDSKSLVFQAVEDKNRWMNCLGVECRKP